MIEVIVVVLIVVIFFFAYRAGVGWIEDSSDLEDFFDDDEEN